MHEITLPANTIATFHIPAATIDDARESGKSVVAADGVSHPGQQGDSRIAHLSSGRCRSTSTSAPAAARSGEARTRCRPGF